MNIDISVKNTKIDYNKDRPIAENPVKVMDLTLRDGHQSLFATRGRTEDMIPVAELMDEVGFWALETWGGATFDTMHRFLNEDPWERIRTLKKYAPKTPFSMLLRAQTLWDTAIMQMMLPRPLWSGQLLTAWMYSGPLMP
jgi:oxaloacetate decarboxylase alpha subunit/pyruvate carboxylase subunit B